MGKQNSLMDLYRSMFIASLYDVASATTYPNAELSRDISTMKCRVEAEGLSFLTKTIPSLGRAVDTALATATCLRFRGFKLKRGTQLPLFLGWLLRQVFDELGHERSDASVVALTWLRQVCLQLGKLGVPTTEKQNEETISNFITTDRNLPELDHVGPYGSHGRVLDGLHSNQDRDLEEGGDPSSRSGNDDDSRGSECHLRDGPRGLFHGMACGRPGRVFLHARLPLLESDYETSVLKTARRLVCRVVAGSDPRGADFAPRHGPGAVAAGERGHRKMSFKTFFCGLDRIYPFGEYFCFNARHAAETAPEWQTYESLGEGTAKVVLVPKDSRGPRLISMEPKEFQWIQQGLRRVLEKAINSSPLTRGMVNFKDQSINRRLALEASAGKPWATLDMKDASDRVSCSLVKRLFPDHWFECMFAARTSGTIVPSGEYVPLRKFAPMGSSLCFPVESLVFWALSVAAIKHKHPSLAVNQAAKRVYVYGDDLIVHIEDQDVILQTLPLFHLKFNEKKCCTAGSFRESCGCDAYKGVDVTPLRIKCVWNRRSGKSLVQHVALHNAACDKGLYHLADLIFDLVSKVRKFPYSDSRNPSCISWVDDRKTAAYRRQYNSLHFKRRMGSERNPKYDYRQREILAWVVQARPYQASLPGYSEMLRIASERGDAPKGHPIVKVAPEDISHNVRFDPSCWNVDTFLPEEPSVRAYTYTSRREVSLKRRWCLESI